MGEGQERDGGRDGERSAPEARHQAAFARPHVGRHARQPRVESLHVVVHVAGQTCRAKRPRRARPGVSTSGVRTAHLPRRRTFHTARDASRLRAAQTKQRGTAPAEFALVLPDRCPEVALSLSHRGTRKTERLEPRTTAWFPRSAPYASPRISAKQTIVTNHHCPASKILPRMPLWRA